MSTTYLFKSERLGFRNWIPADIPKMAAINEDPMVMEYFPSIPDLEQTKGFVEVMQSQFAENGYCYFAVEKLSDASFIGFIGLAEQTYPADFTPCVDIGWRLAQAEWGKGFATEGAMRCLDFAFGPIGLEKVVAVCPEANEKSQRVMKKLGMIQKASFNHPLLQAHKALEKCFLYELKRPIQ